MAYTFYMTSVIRPRKVRPRTTAWYKLYVEATSGKVILPDLPQMQANTQPYSTIQSPSEQTDAFIYSATSRIYRRSEQANELSLVAFRV